jgi:hypothetical protein
MSRVMSLEEIEPGDVLWAHARGYWRQVRVLGTGRRTATVAYVIRATQAASASVKVQDLDVNRLRRDRPLGHYGVLDAPAPKGPGPAVQS